MFTGYVTWNITEPMDQPSPLREDADLLPPLRSAKEFPVAPKAEKLPALYPECLQALNDANEARHLLKAKMAKKKDVIVEIRTEIGRLEQDLALEAETRMRLHAMNEKLLGALREIEQMADDVSQTVEEAHRVPRTRLGGLIEKLKALVRTWRAFKLDQQTALTKAAGQGHDEQSDA